MNFKSKIKMEGRGPISLWLGDSQVWMKTALEKDKSSGRGQSGVEVDSNELNVAHVCVGLAFELVLKALAKSERLGSDGNSGHQTFQAASNPA